MIQLKIVLRFTCHGAGSDYAQCNVPTVCADLAGK